MCDILERHIAVFGLKLGTNPPAYIWPFKVQLKDGAKPVRSSERRYGTIQQHYMESTIKNLEKIVVVINRSDTTKSYHSLEFRLLICGRFWRARITSILTQ